MRTSMKFLGIPALGVLVLGLAAFTYQDKEQAKEWKVPEADQKVKNPVKADKESKDAGAELYAKYCKSCHGKFGEGDGTKAAELKTELIDFTSGKFQGQTDGAIFYKMVKGRDEMPASKKKIPEDEDIWNIVNYIRTFGKK